MVARRPRIPTPHVVEVLVRVDGPRDAHGEKTETWLEPRPEPVYGWHGVIDADAESQGSRQAVVDDLRLLVPPGFRIGTKDRVKLPNGKIYEVVGEPEDYGNGPFGFNPGGRVILQRVSA